MKKLLILSVFASLLVFKASAQITIPAKSASKHIGKKVKIIDKVYGGKMDPGTRITNLYIGGLSPNQALTVMIPIAYGTSFKSKPDIYYKGKDVIITGILLNYKGKPGIIVTNPQQLKLVMVDNAHTPALKVPKN